MTETDGRELCGLLTEEERQYRRLRRLAWRQTAYMRRNFTDRLVANALEWQKYLPLADEARARRIACLNRLAGDAQLPKNCKLSQYLQQCADTKVKEQVQAAAERLLRTAEDLKRQNELNGDLANWCLKLVAEESRIFRHCVLDDPSGCYDGDAEPRPSAPGGVVVEQA